MTCGLWVLICILIRTNWTVASGACEQMSKYRNCKRAVLEIVEMLLYLKFHFMFTIVNVWAPDHQQYDKLMEGIILR